MNDITKAKYFLKNRQSDLQHLTTFGLMLATAESRLKELKLKMQGRSTEGLPPEALEAREIEILLDVAVLRYLKRYNQLPPNVQAAFQDGVTMEEKKALALAWVYA